MAAGTAIKQSSAVFFIHQEEMPPVTAIMVAVFSTVFNSANTIFSMTATASYFTPSVLTRADGATGASPLFWIEVGVYVLGMGAEPISEVQRRNFKADPKNSGKPYTSGLLD